MDTDATVRAAREHLVCLPPTSLAWIDVTGADRLRFLHALLSNVVLGVAPGAGNRSVLLTDKGRMVAPVEVLVAEEAVHLGVPASLGDTVLAALDGYVIADDVELALTDRQTLPVLGPEAPAKIAGLLGAPLPDGDHAHRPGTLAGRPVIVARLGLHGVPDATVLCAPADVDAIVSALAIAGVAPGDPAAGEVLRVEAGLPAWGAELTADTLPMEAGLGPILHATKGCYVGQETVVRVRSRGHVNWLVRGLLLDGAEPPAPGTAVTRPDGKRVGKVTSALRSPTLGITVALARLRHEVGEPGTRLDVEGVGAEVVDPPFVP